MNASSRLPLPVVTADDYQGGRAAGDYLRELGHRRIAMYVNKDAVPHYSQRERLRGLIDGIGSRTNNETIVQFVHDLHHEAATRLFEQVQIPTAIVCYSHYEAVPMLKEIADRKLCVPKDLSLIAFNDCFPLDCTIPPITRLSVPTAKIGEHAAHALLRQIESGHRRGSSKPAVFEERLVIRESCAAPPLN